MKSAETDGQNDAPVMQERRASKSRFAGIFSGIIIASTIGMYCYLLIHGNPANLDGVVLGRILGTLDTSFGIVLAYWLGTSASAHGKDELIARANARKGASK